MTLRLIEGGYGTGHLDKGGFSVEDEPPNGGGGNGGDGMEARVKRLEGDLSEIKSDMKVVRSDLAELKGKVSMLPGYPGIATIMALVGGGLLIVSRIFPSGLPSP